MGVEFELKYRATPDILRQIDGFAEGETVRYAMQTTYFDTPSGALSQRFYTLRTRQEYAKATGLETLFGALYLLGRTERLNELFAICMEMEG